VNATDGSHVIAVLHGKFLEKVREGVEAVMDVIFVGIAT